MEEMCLVRVLVSRKQLGSPKVIFRFAVDLHGSPLSFSPFSKGEVSFEMQCGISDSTLNSHFITFCLCDLEFSHLTFQIFHSPSGI